MTARRRSRDTNTIGVNPVILGVITDEPHRSVHVLYNFGDRVAGLAAVDHREDSVTSIRQWPDKGWQKSTRGKRRSRR